MLLSIEGIDGAGKNTLATAVRNAVDMPVKVVSFPRYEASIHAQLARAALYGEMGDLTDSAYAMATLFALDRFAVKEELLAAKESREVVILDRYVASNAAYSAARLRDDSLFQWVYDLEFGTLGLPQADLQVYVDMSVEVASARAQSRAAADCTRERDHYERDGGLQERTAAAYRRLVESGWGGCWIATADADTITTAIHDLVGD
ncbi:dTMP kinase [Corynebacterium macginleyi]|uniref:dTMP kinase n=1 Tax=Corynebacterium macginleyi TaxID=38290 RepID=UPI00190D204E|nr:dTMP kinase [Corynebacterium macginleyi]MBK4142481.1 dTMP kinase [Corynebacterium macginleyi]